MAIAWPLSRDAGFIPDCNPFLDGCASISRAARHGDANPVFKALMLPCAALQGLHWWLAARWLALHGSGARAMRTLAVVAATALAVYVFALGSDGALYGWMRRYGITFYFAGSFLAMALFVRALLAHGAHRGFARTLAALCWAMLALGLASVLAPLAAAGAQLDRAQNALEWQLGALFTAWFVAHAALWRAQRFPATRPA